MKSILTFRYLAVFSLLIIIFAECKNPAPAHFELKVPSYARLPYDTRLDAVKWTGGYWQDRIQRITDIYLPHIYDDMFLDPKNGASFRNFLKVAGMEQGGRTGARWGDGDCYYILDASARVYAQNQNEYLKDKMDYWIPVIARCKREDGIIDTWSSLGGTWGPTLGDVTYNHGHLYAAASSHQIATGVDTFKLFANKVLTSYLESNRPIGNNIPITYCSLFKLTGEERYLNPVIKRYNNDPSPFGPPLRSSGEIFGHGTVAHHYLIGASALYDCTGEEEILASLKRLADNLMAKKVFITGALGSVSHGPRPDQIVDGKEYKGVEIREAVGQAYDLSNDSSYNESCTICLNMEWMYRMFRLTGDAIYMDAVERSLYNGIPGCVDLENGRFFYANPQEQTAGSTRNNTLYDKLAPNQDRQLKWYTWKRVSPMSCSCCPPKILRALAMSNEIACSVNDEGLWVNLYGSSTLSTELPRGGSFELEQATDYPWDGKVSLRMKQVKSKQAFTVFLRIPGWVNTPISISLNGETVEKEAQGGSYYPLNREWKGGDVIEMEFPMPVRFMAADPRVKDNIGKVSVMRGPVVYCLEDEDIPKGTDIESLYLTVGGGFKPVFTEELGGLIKLAGSLIIDNGGKKEADVTKDFDPDKGLYQEIKLPGNILPAEGDRAVEVSMIPYYARLNREGHYFKIWLPVYSNQ